MKGQAKLCERLRDVTAVGLTTDMWTSRAMEGYITAAAHFWDRFKTKLLILATTGFVDRHIGANIRRRLVDITRNADVCGVVSAVTHDEASAQCCALQTVKEVTQKEKLGNLGKVSSAPHTGYKRA